MSVTHEHGHAEHAPVLAYEEVNEEVTEATEAQEVVDLNSLSAEDRLELLQRVLADNEALRRKEAALQAALKVKGAVSTRARKDPERDARFLTQVVTDIVKHIPEQTTEKATGSFRRYVGSVNIDIEGTPTRFHATVVVKQAKRG